MGVKDIAAMLNAAAAGIHLEAIASSFVASRQEDFDRRYALEIARQRLARSGLDYHKLNDDFPFIVTNLGGAIIGVAPRAIVPEYGQNSRRPGRSYLEKHSRKMLQMLEGQDGFVYMLPFQMNGRVVRENLERFVNVAFVDLHYNKRDLECRFYRHHVLPATGTGY